MFVLLKGLKIRKTQNMRLVLGYPAFLCEKIKFDTENLKKVYCAKREASEFCFFCLAE